VGSGGKGPTELGTVERAHEGGFKGRGQVGGEQMSTFGVAGGVAQAEAGQGEYLAA
jgi:hypothetical protein